MIRVNLCLEKLKDTDFTDLNRFAVAFKSKKVAATMLPYRAVATGEVIQCPTTGLPDKSKSTCHSRTTRASGADQNGHPGKVKARGGGGERKKGWGLVKVRRCGNCKLSD